MDVNFDAARENEAGKSRDSLRGEKNLPSRECVVSLLVVECIGHHATGGQEAGTVVLRPKEIASCEHFNLFAVN